MKNNFEDSSLSNDKIIFSIVMACYNVEKYVDEAIKSVINQSFNFNESIEVILVDDGSTDNTSEICKKYCELYPNNIKYFFKENGGQASARNFGIKFARGKYVNFLDADDKFMPNTFENVFNFFESHFSEIDLVAVPMYFFERETGDHPLNYKFEENAVLDLTVSWKNPQLATNSAFFKTEIFNDFQFDTNLISSEDAVMVNKILLEKQTYGVVAGDGLCYRKRFDESSTIDISKLNKEFYNDRLNGYFIELINYSTKKLGYVPKFIQYTLIYDIKWLLTSDVSESLLDDEELSEFYDNVKFILNNISDDIIISHLEMDSRELKKYIFQLKYGDYEIRYEDNDIFMYINNILIDNLKMHFLYIDIIEIKNDNLFISGFLKSYFTSDDITIELIVNQDNNKQTFSCSLFNYYNRKESNIYKSAINFDFEVPLDINNAYEFFIGVRIKDDDSSVEVPIKFLNYARLSEVSSYSVWGDYFIRFNKNKFYINKYSYSQMIKHELRILAVIFKNMPPYWTSALFFRFLYLCLFPIYKRKRIWMFMDRIDKAGDNAEYLYEYCMGMDDGINKYFTLSKDSSDFSRLNYLKNILAFYSIKRRFLYLFAEKIISSHPDEFILNPFWGKNVQLYSGLINSEKIFLQHGITKDNISLWLRKYDKNLSLLVTVSDFEAESFLKYEYNYSKDVIQVLGFPRFDNLNKSIDKKQILISPTWRRYVDNLEDSQIVHTLYYEKINSLFNNEQLIEMAKNLGYKIIIKPHPKLYDILDLFDDNDYVEIDLDSDYQDLFNSSSILITDYSSVAFDFAYIKKPVIYYQYANDYHFNETFFDYEEMGFGKVISDEEQLINCISEYLNNDCVMEDKYVERVDKFFKFKDKNNCKRVYDALLKLK